MKIRLRWWTVEKQKQSGPTCWDMDISSHKICKQIHLACISVKCIQERARAYFSLAIFFTNHFMKFYLYLGKGHEPMIGRSLLISETLWVNVWWHDGCKFFFPQTIWDRYRDTLVDKWLLQMTPLYIQQMIPTQQSYSGVRSSQLP